MKMKARLISFQIVTGLLVLLFLVCTWTIKTQQDSANLSAIQKDSLIDVNLMLKSENDALRIKIKEMETYNSYSSYTSNSTETFETTDSKSYWFVVWMNKSNGSRMNGIIEQDKPYFSMKEFKKSYGDNFVLNIVKVSRGSWENQ